VHGRVTLESDAGRAVLTTSYGLADGVAPTRKGVALAFDETLAERIRLALADVPELYERLMFGGIAFMLSDHMTCGVIGDALLLRLGPEGAEQALGRPHVRPMDFTGRPMRSMVLIDPEGLRDDDELERWLRAATAFVATLPPKRRRRTS
jgi:TfoX/Sxy family transcriptional regulator of competence genes